MRELKLKEIDLPKVTQLITKTNIQLLNSPSNSLPKFYVAPCTQKFTFGTKLVPKVKPKSVVLPYAHYLTLTSQREPLV